MVRWMNCDLRHTSGARAANDEIEQTVYSECVEFSVPPDTVFIPEVTYTVLSGTLNPTH